MPFAAEQTRQAQHAVGSHLELDIVRSALRMARQVSPAADWVPLPRPCDSTGLSKVMILQLMCVQCTLAFGDSQRHQSQLKQLQGE